MRLLIDYLYNVIIVGVLMVFLSIPAILTDIFPRAIYIYPIAALLGVAALLTYEGKKK